MKRRIDIHGNTDSNPYEDASINPYTGYVYSQRYYDILSKRKQLPVYEFKAELLQNIKEHQSIVVEGETGSGKTTQIPQFLVPILAKHGKMIACTQVIDSPESGEDLCNIRNL
jgi:pre-mRNA-splicing factor ATP-dependent RNA helicase DHX15/PRP43